MSWVYTRTIKKFAMEKSNTSGRVGVVYRKQSPKPEMFLLFALTDRADTTENLCKGFPERKPKIQENQNPERNL